MVALHGRHLMRSFWRSRIGVSFPRIRARAGGTFAHHPVDDAALVQMLCAMRLTLPDAELVLSTREPAELRDRLIPLGVTRMSAGSCTAPGGYRGLHEAGEQFEVVDPRSPAEVAAEIERAGFEPVWKDQDRALTA
jgi:2-iminoacetate synthase